MKKVSLFLFFWCRLSMVLRLSSPPLGAENMPMKVFLLFLITFSSFSFAKGYQVLIKDALKFFIDEKLEPKTIWKKK
jgi:hypothetical protein